MCDFIFGVARFEPRRQNKNQPWRGEMGAAAAFSGEGGGTRFRDEAQKRQLATAGGEEGSSRAKTTIGGSRFETRLKNDNQPRQGGRRAAAASPGEGGGRRCRIDAGDWKNNARPPPDLPPRNCEGNNDDDKSNDDNGYDKCDNYVDDNHGRERGQRR